MGELAKNLVGRQAPDILAALKGKQAREPEPDDRRRQWRRLISGAAWPSAAGMETAPDTARLKRLRFRAWHRGTREADYMIGCFFDRFHAEWGEAELGWFETLIEEEDVDILGWALGTLSVPEEYAGPLMERLKRLDYVDIPR